MKKLPIQVRRKDIIIIIIIDMTAGILTQWKDFIYNISKHLSDIAY
jgi:hypothetical protein